MERYDLRSCFLPDLSGLHVRIYQFRELLRLNLPSLWSHLEDLQVETAYVSQWFLSFFAVTCPLPMLFRIYDVVFAEGASETLMRVALSLMRKNESRLLACAELEDVMQLLLSRGLWDCYHYNADEFVQDFAGLTSVVTREKLSQLEQGYRESLVTTANTVRTSDITTAATRFLGRIWAPSSNSSLKNSTLAPGLSAPSRPLSMLRRSASKQSLASTLNSIEASSASVVSSSSTDATTMSRDSSNTEEESSSRESTPVGPKSLGSIKNTDDKYLHSQIEDLLTALSELQRNHSLLSNQLQQEQEEREEDRKAVRLLLDGLRQKASSGKHGSDDTEPRIDVTEVDDDDNDDAEDVVKDNRASGEDLSEDATTPLSDKTTGPSLDAASIDGAEAPSTEDLSELLDRVEMRFGAEAEKRRSSMMQSKSQLRTELAQSKDQLASAMSQTQEFNRRIHDLEQEMTVLKEQLRERHGHVRSLHQDKQRLEKQIHSLRSRASASSASEPPGSRETDAEWANKGVAGLREFKLNRSKSTPSQSGSLNKRLSSSTRGPEEAAMDDVVPANDQDALLLELVQAKTAEAIAKQEAEEAKQKLEALRKACGLAPGDSPGPSFMGGSVTNSAMGVFGRLTGQGMGSTPDNGGKVSAPAAGGSPGAGGFWGWRR